MSGFNINSIKLDGIESTFQEQMDGPSHQNSMLPKSRPGYYNKLNTTTTTLSDRHRKIYRTSKSVYGEQVKSMLEMIINPAVQA